MSYLDHQHHQPVILHLAERAKVTDSIAPDAHSVADEPLASRTRIVECGDLGKVPNYSSSHLAVELSQLFEREPREVDAIGQARA